MMFQLDQVAAAAKATPYWLDLTAPVRVQVRPYSAILHEVAIERARELTERLSDSTLGALLTAAGLLTLEAGLPVEEQPGLDDLTAADRRAINSFLLSVGMAQVAIVDWDGVADAEGPAPATAENILTLLLDQHQARAFRREYLTPALARSAEGNGFTPSPNGNGAGAADSASAAGIPTRPARAVKRPPTGRSARA